MFPIILPLVAGGLACALSLSHALALEGGSIDSNADPTFAGVGSLTLATGGTFSGVLIGSRHVLTAQHVVGATSLPSQWTFNVHLASLASADRSYTVTNIFRAPGFTGFDGNEPPRNDLAILELSRGVAAAVAPFALSLAPLGIGDEITLVGYGGTGAAIKRRGTNLIEFLDPEPGPAATPDVFAYDLDTDTPDQATVIGGDSGSGAFIRSNAVWKLAGINTFSWTDPDVPGTGAVRGGGGLIVSAYTPWILATMVPEPRAWTFFASGLLLLGLRLAGASRARHAL